MKTIILVASIATMLTVAAMPVKFLDQTPIVDGEFASDPGWRHTEDSFSMRRLGDNAEPERSTSFHIGYGIDAIYLAVEAMDPDPDALVTDASNQGALWQDDSIEIFLTDQNGRGIHLIANAAGARYNRPLNWSDCPAPNQLWNWNAVPQRFQQGYRLEVRIPYLLLPADVDYRALYFNICRNAQGKSPELSTYARLANGVFFDPENFVPLKLIHASGAESIPARLAADRLSAWRDDAPRQYEEAQRKNDRYFRQYRAANPESANRMDALLLLPERTPAEEEELRQLAGDALRVIAEVTREQTEQIMDQLFQEK